MDVDRFVAEENAGLLYLVFNLIDRGLSADRIAFALEKMVGHDWLEVPVEVWLWRLQVSCYVPTEHTALSVDMLEALIIGCIRLQDLEWLAR